MGRPGIMVYFDILEPIRVLSDADKGRLLVAMLEYGRDGTVPQFEGMVALAWGFVCPKIDRDMEEYERTVLRRQYAAFCRERKRKGEQELSFEQWRCGVEGQKHHVISHDGNDDQWYPTTTTTAAATATTTTTTATAAAATATATTTPTPTTTANAADGNIAAATAAQSELKMWGGKLGKGVVLLSQQQAEDLLDKLGLDAFDYYVDKLSGFILKNDAKVKNHYETILKWWREDCGLENRERR